MRIATPFLLAVLALPVLTAPARAHAILMESQPAAEAVVPPGRLHLVFRFNSRIDQPRSRLELRGGPAGRAPTAVPIMPATTPDTLTADTTVPAGDWVLRWQVLAVDGHITRGDVPITVK